MSDIAIHVENLSKRYKIGARQKRYPTLRDQISDIGSGVLNKGRQIFTRQTPSLRSQSEDIFWALKDVSFEVKRGEVVGIIGRNGAGKSTLLKILSRITKPTSGRVRLYGRVGSLLEVGTGFHAELSGRENIYLSGAILGMKKREIDRKFDEIVAFAEVDKFVDTPVKHYSSGMYVRLAFAVAAHLEPEILLVDEVLAVGDAAFQKKCLGKMGDVAKEGRTVLFVSHNLQVISTLTQGSLLLDQGVLMFNGDTNLALRNYRSSMTESCITEYTDYQKEQGVICARVITSEPGQIHRFGEKLVFEFELLFQAKPGAAGFSFQVVDEEMRPIMYHWLFNADMQWGRAGKVVLRCMVPNPRIYMGRYSLVTWLADRTSRQIIENLKGICPFEVVMDGISREYEWRPGTCTYLEDSEWLVD
jgi:lipopolysaccharide transport system ATP-binding protein